MPLGNVVSLLAFGGTATIVFLAGRAWRPRPWATTRSFEAWLTLLAGALTLHVWMLALTWLGRDWRADSVLIPLGVLALLSVRWRRSGAARTRTDPSRRTDRRGLRLGDGVALVALAVLGALLTNACLTMSDFIFHWGFKAHQWWLGHRIDFQALTQPWNIPRHPDYPPLLPSVFVATAFARGEFTEAPLIAWSLLFAVGATAAAREALYLAVRDAWIRQATLVVVAATVAFMTITYRLGGSPDLLLAAVIASTVPLLLAAPTSRHDGAMGLIAAVAVATKVEGTPFAAIAITVYLARRLRARAALADRGPGWRPFAQVLLPALLVAVPWWLLVARHQLAAERRQGGFDHDRIADMLEALATSLLDPAWHGLGLVLLLVPLALWVSRTRAPALVIVGQLGFYAWVYLDTPHDAVELVRTSAVRLMLHVWPATMVLVAIVADHVTDHVATRSGPVAKGSDGRHPRRATGTMGS